MTLDSNTPVFAGTQEALISYTWLDEGDLHRNSSGDLLPWAQQEEMMKTLGRPPYSRWNILDIVVSSLGEDAKGRAKFEVKALIQKDLAPIHTKKRGFLSYYTMVGIPSFVKNPFVSARTEYTITAPRFAGIAHNSEGEFKVEVLNDGSVGKRLVSRDIHDSEDVIRLVHASPIIQNPVFSWAFGFSFWNVALGLYAIIVGMAGYCMAVFFDIMKDEHLKPAAKRLLQSAGLMK